MTSVLATIVTRLRQDNGGTVPLAARYDQYERVIGPALPHLFPCRTSSWQWQVISSATIQVLLNQTLARIGLRDTAGQPLRYTSHDFRRFRHGSRGWGPAGPHHRPLARAQRA
ncbi:hypothetical protein [Nocardia carnea]|uniref:hypothetical protein n=1 Tax=Nocardia carnea TaxID=37328 RepID=UPI00245442A0|nr:hypothetical protein [Nocardia carnea]